MVKRMVGGIIHAIAVRLLAALEVLGIPRVRDDSGGEGSS
jgi:hypothetical protein